MEKAIPCSRLIALEWRNRIEFSFETRKRNPVLCNSLTQQRIPLSSLINDDYHFSISSSRKPRPEDLIQYTISDKQDKRIQKAHVNSVFFKQLRELLRKSFDLSFRNVCRSPRTDRTPYRERGRCASCLAIWLQSCASKVNCCGLNECNWIR